VVASQVEPRLVERRRQVRQAEHRRRTRRLVVIGAVFAVLAAAVAALLSPLSNVDRVTVVGSGDVRDEDVLAASGIDRGDQLLELDVQDARRRIMALPRVASARVVREWPDEVRISITEERPVASLVTADDVVLVSSTGRVLEQLTEPDPSLPQMSVEGPAPVGSELSDRLGPSLAVFVRMSEDLVPELSTASLTADGTMTFELPDGAVVEFGPPEDVASKLVALQSVLSQVVRDCMATLDVREPSRPSVSRGPGCPGVSPETSAGSSPASKADASTDAEPKQTRA